MTPEPYPSSPPPLEPERTPEPPPLSEFSRLLGVFTSPSTAFADIARRPSWWVPIVIGIVISVVYLYAFSSHVGFDQLIRKQLDQSSQTQNLTGAQREQAIQTLERVLPIGIYGGVLIGPVFFTFVVAVVLMFLFDNIMGANIGLKRFMAIVSYGQLPRVIVTALSMLVMYLKPPEDFDIQNPLVFNLGVLIPSDAPMWQKRLGASFDLFTFWMIALTALGICAAAPKIKFGKALGGILFPWALWVILIVGLAAAFG